jgi:hypothetical protein
MAGGPAPARSPQPRKPRQHTVSAAAHDPQPCRHIRENTDKPLENQACCLMAIRQWRTV